MLGVVTIVVLGGCSAGPASESAAVPYRSVAHKTSPPPPVLVATSPADEAAPAAIASASTMAAHRWSAGTGRGAPMTASEPVRIEIPAIGVDSKLMKLGLNPDGTMQVPPSAFPAGWYTGAPTPGELGPAIIAGHVDWGKQHGVFHDLVNLVAGDEVAVTRADGSLAVFRVTDVVQFPKSAFPTADVYGNIDHAGLRLVTCGGSFDRAVGHYRDNVVAYAELVTSHEG